MMHTSGLLAAFRGHRREAGTRVFACVLSTVCVVFLSGTLAAAQQPKLPDIRDISLGIGEYVPTGFTGIGARSMGMGGVSLATVNDGSALFWNPAALTNVRRVELMGGLGHMKSSPSTSVVPGTPRASHGSLSFTRLNTAILTAPYPVYRGGLTFALGASRPVDYTYRSQREGTESIRGTDYHQEDIIRRDGGISEYAIGMGVEVSPNVALGFAAHWLSGGVNIRRDLTLQQLGSSMPDSLYGLYREDTDITGFAFTVSTSARLPLGIKLGVSARPPVTYKVDGTWGDAYEEAVGTQIYTYNYRESPLKYDIKGPWKLGVGMSWVTYAFTAGADVWFEDWTQASFSGGSPYENISGVNTDTFFEDRYSSKLRVHLGVEALIPWIHTVARVGYYRNPDQFTGPVLATGEPVRYDSEADFFTFGLGWLIDDTVTLDVAYVVGGDTYRTGSLTEKRASSHVFATVAFRM